MTHSPSTPAAEVPRASDVRFRALLEYAGDAIVVADAGGRILIANEETTRLFGYDREELLGEGVELLLPTRLRHRHVGHRTGFMETHARRAMGARLSLRGRRRDGSEFPIEVSLGPLEQDGERLVAAIIRDVSERHGLEEELRWMADHDALTGLVNRRRLTAELDRHLDEARAARAPGAATGALLLVDLDNVKYVNDSLGHTAGDAVIRDAGAVLLGLVRAGDVLARIGGDEFVVLLADGDAGAGLALAERILRAFEARAAAGVDTPEAAVTASIGVAAIGGRAHAITGEQLLAEADIAMYAAKDGGRNRACVHGRDTGSPTRLHDDLARANRLHRALADGGLVLYAQPIVAVGELAPPARFELLLRLRDADGAVHAPGAFLPLAERFGLARRIDRWVIGESLRLAAEYPGVERLSINLSATSLTDADLADHIADRAAAAGVDPARLLFEVTETAAIANLEAARRLAERLRALGCRLALDDFGTGFSTFSSLKQLPFDAVKIDGSFIRRICEDASDQVIVRSMVQVAHGLGKTATAEWVEDEGTLRRLAAYGVDDAQGYHLGEPRPAAKAFAALR